MVSDLLSGYMTIMDVSKALELLVESLCSIYDKSKRSHMTELPTEQARPSAKGVIPLAILGAIIATVMLLSLPSTAGAATSPYCNNVTLGGYAECNGAARGLNGVYGWGDQHSVCVRAAANAWWSCSGGPSQGVYQGSGCYYQYPYISNNAWGANTVHGVAYNC